MTIATEIADAHGPEADTYVDDRLQTYWSSVKDRLRAGDRDKHLRSRIFAEPQRPTPLARITHEDGRVELVTSVDKIRGRALKRAQALRRLRDGERRALQAALTTYRGELIE